MFVNKYKKNNFKHHSRKIVFKKRFLFKNNQSKSNTRNKNTILHNPSFLMFLKRTFKKKKLKKLSKKIFFKLNINFMPSIKTKNSRMGKGKGDPYGYKINTFSCYDKVVFKN